ncbi:Clp amino terminal domain-containing protein, pathogenicity island component [Actinokineospora alba]|uniref:Clp amino terminal domain-containing protein, pathogenicity island component n=1 Tax=Actinokineospora alba TaxID=504798 RepID=A0A1H0NQW5_9PSEU|nr:Clp protease N-terminal domain-containing protein [Actinokineospora alba]TDP68811.1 ClpA/ClpB-like protein [Actinokineospora alba]SDH87130.1 Clp amino terminal domain-containing protein, pathogenicity island component [Actinokineospora alba]SDO95049.1 Clp amino terminal domain-containing protein, pathogenicity island component [Actinokineospora alba]
MTTPRLDDLIGAIRATYSDENPLGQLSAAVIAAEYLGEISDHLIGHFVDQARRSGASWTDIGKSMGVTKQAAQKRFVSKDDPNMFARFTEKARQAVVASQTEAQQSKRSRIYPEHLLLGLLSAPDSLAMKALGEQGIDADKIRAGVVLPEAGDAEPGPLVEFSPACKKALELSVRESLRLSHNYVGTEHLLLALFEIDESPLPALGADRAKAEEFITKALAKLLEARG